MSTRRKSTFQKDQSSQKAPHLSASKRSKSFGGRTAQLKKGKAMDLMDDDIPGMHPLGGAGSDTWVDSPGPADGLRRQELCSRVMLTISARSVKRWGTFLWLVFCVCVATLRDDPGIAGSIKKEEEKDD
jgi:hypothetical protein